MVTDVPAGEAKTVRATRTGVLTALIAVGVVGCASASLPGPSGPATSAASTSATSTPLSPTPSPTPAPGGNTAAAGLASFFAVASQQDAQLRAAARLINSGIGSTTIVLAPQAKAAVTRIDPALAAHAIPAGLDPVLQLAVLVVYSELDSRRQAMRRVADLALRPGTSVLPRNGTGADGGADLVRCLANGAAAAARFQADLSAARGLAERTPAFTPSAPRSADAADLALRIALVNGHNSGCASCGGFIATTLAPVTWQPVTVAGTHWDGTVGGSGAQPGGIRFQAVYVVGRGWQVQLAAC